MMLKNKFYSHEQGGVLILVALMTPLLLTIVGITIDLGKVYAVRSKAQNALDAAVLGAVSGATSTNLRSEARRIFRANYPIGYMGSTDSGLNVTQSGSVYNGTVRVRMPWSIMQIFGFRQADFRLNSKVSRSSVGQTIELALVIDNSDTINTNQLKNPTRQFISDLFNNQATQPTYYISVVPFAAAVNVGRTPISRLSWPQNQAQFLALGSSPNGYLANRNPDIPSDPNFIDYTDAPPTTDITTRFRIPNGIFPGTFGNGDAVRLALPQILFASNSRSDIYTAINNFASGGRTRYNVGLMWGWYMLSPRWTGLWDPGRAGLPLPASAARSKSMILLVGSNNNVYLGGTQTCGAFTCAVPDDNLSTIYMCALIKGQGIHLYTIGYGNSNNYNSTLLQSCATSASNFYEAGNANELSDVYNQIIDDLKYDSIRLSQ